MRDAQQMKAKSDTNLVLDNNTALWLKDYAQKVLAEKHHERLFWEERDECSYRCVDKEYVIE